MPTEQKIKEWLRTKYADQHTADIIWDKMCKSQYFQGITVSYNDEGETDIPERDVMNAYRDATGRQVPLWSWD